MISEHSPQTWTLLSSECALFGNFGVERAPRAIELVGHRGGRQQGRGAKILVFHYKRKKQYKKMQGHRQNFVEVKINEILVNGKSFKA